MKTKYKRKGRKKRKEKGINRKKRKKSNENKRKGRKNERERKERKETMRKRKERKDRKRIFLWFIKYFTLQPMSNKYQQPMKLKMLIIFMFGTFSKRR